MWSTNDKNFSARGFSTPPASWKSPHTPGVMMPMSERKEVAPACKRDLFHIIHKVPSGDSPYVRAKRVQLIEKDPCRAISLFWAAINAGDRVDSALKDMAVVMKQLNRSDEAIEAIKSFRHLCPYDSQESLDNVLVELYKRSGRVDEEIEMLQHKLKSIEEGMAFGGKRTKTARSQGKKIQITVEQERSRILGNLAWAYLQQHNYGLAEQHYRKALALEPDKNKQCNLAICLMHMNRMLEAKSLLQVVRTSCGSKPMDESYAKSYERAVQILSELESQSVLKPIEQHENNQKSLAPPANGELKEVSGWTNQAQGLHIRGSCWTNNSENLTNFSEYEKNWRKDSYSESPGGWSGFASKMKENQISSASPAPVLYTQPRRGSWNFNKGDQRVEIKNALAPPIRNLSGELDSAAEKSASDRGQGMPLTEPLSQPAKGGPQIKISCVYDDYAPDSQLGSWRKNHGDNGGLNKSAIEQTTEADKTIVSEVSGNVKPTSTTIGQSCSTKSANKISWADMAEEEEEEEELITGKVQSQYFDNWNHEEDFNNENLDSNIFHQNAGPNYEVGTMSQKLEALDLKEAYGTPNNAGSSRNPAVRRSLCFEAGNRRRNRLQVFRDITHSPDSP